MIDVVALLWGTRYSFEYAHNLYASISRNSTVPHRFVLFTDQDVQPWAYSLPDFYVRSIRHRAEGWWNKLCLFEPGIGLSERVVFLDLDTVIVDSVDWLLNYDGDFAGIENLGVANAKYENVDQYKRKFQSAIMAWNRDSSQAEKIWNSWRQHYGEIQTIFRGDGEFLDSAVATSKRDLLQDIYPGKIRSYKYECYDDGVPEGTSIVCFHGEPTPKQAIDKTVMPYGVRYDPRPWVADYWRST